MDSKIRRLLKKLNELQDRTSTEKYIAKTSEETKDYNRNKVNRMNKIFYIHLQNKK